MEKGRWELEVVVRCNANHFANVPYSMLLSETLGVVIWIVVLFVICLAASFLNAPLSCKQGCKEVTSVQQKCNSNTQEKQMIGSLQSSMSTKQQKFCESTAVYVKVCQRHNVAI